MRLRARQAGRPLQRCALALELEAGDGTQRRPSLASPVAEPAHSFGDVVLVPFPFTDQTASKKRPAVVVSADAYHHRRPDVIKAQGCRSRL